MENKILAIKGHSTRGSEVIALLEMLGGINTHNLYGDESYAYYTIDCDKEIKGGIYVFGDENLSIFTLEQFEEKFPYKVMDKVNSPCKGCIKTITSMKWDTYLNTVTYILDNKIYTNIDQLKVVNDLQPYKEEIKAEDRLEIYTDPAIDNDSKTAIDIFISNKSLGLKNGYIANKVEIKDCGILLKCVKNKPQYPKTFQECYPLKYNGQINLNIGCDILHGAYSEQLECLQSLLICRDAYLKIAGEEMGLSEPWNPDWTKADERKYCIVNTEGNITKWVQKTTNKILAFPTEEMCDAFFENFKDLIEKCKEFL